MVDIESVDMLTFSVWSLSEQPKRGLEKTDIRIRNHHVAEHDSNEYLERY